MATNRRYNRGVFLNANHLYWDNLPEEILKDPNINFENLRKVFSPIIEILNNYINKINQNRTTFECHLMNSSLVEVSTQFLADYRIENENELKKQLYEKEIFDKNNKKKFILDSKKYKIESIGKYSNTFLITPRLKEKTHISGTFEANNSKLNSEKDFKTDFIMEFKPYIGTTISVKIDTNRDSKKFHELCRGNSKPFFKEIINRENLNDEIKIDKPKLYISKTLEDEGIIIFNNEYLPKIFKFDTVPNTSTIKKKKKALEQLLQQPVMHNAPLLSLFGNSKTRNYKNHTSNLIKAIENKTEINNWHYLKDERYPGLEQQRKFVKMALDTDDFAILEGPPGSGKTTTILEILHQATMRNLKVMFVASTNVAVDNVLERIDAERKIGNEKQIFAIRIGHEKSIFGDAKKYLYENRAKTERDTILNNLRHDFKLGILSDAQKDFYEYMKGDQDEIKEIILNLANVVCGTTIGILQYPDIKQKDACTCQPFDMLIIDEASKTTLQEFLVPALYAKKFIIIGDKMQLSPYIDEDEISSITKMCNIENVFNEKKSFICTDVKIAHDENILISDIKYDHYDYKYHIKRHNKFNGVVLILKEKSGNIITQYDNLDSKISCAALMGASGIIIDKDIVREESILNLLQIIHPEFDIKYSYKISNSELKKLKREISEKIIQLRNNRANALMHKTKNPKQKTFKIKTWGDEITWRLKRTYEMRKQATDSDDKSQYKWLVQDIIDLLPNWKFSKRFENWDIIKKSIKVILFQPKYASQKPLLRKLGRDYEEILRNLYINGKGLEQSLKNLLRNPVFNNEAFIKDFMWIVVKADYSAFAKNRETISKLFPEFMNDLLRCYVANIVFDTLRIEFPSIIELLQEGLMIIPDYKMTKIYDCIIYKGMNKTNANNLENRFVSLTYQHRMHPEISQPIRVQFYQNKNLLDPDGEHGKYNIATRRTKISNERYHNLWIDAYGQEEGEQSKYNLEEIKVIVKKMKSLLGWLKLNKKEDGSDWIIAVLTFYRGQEKKLRSEIHKKFHTSGDRSYQRLPNSNIIIRIGNVDSFQGQEADIVFLSFVRTKSIGFLDSPNRLNVAMSRAKYQQYLVGNAGFFKEDRVKKRAPQLYEIVKNIKKDIAIKTRN